MKAEILITPKFQQKVWVLPLDLHRVPGGNKTTYLEKYECKRFNNYEIEFD
jgi:hypothetical protein